MSEIINRFNRLIKRLNDQKTLSVSVMVKTPDQWYVYKMQNFEVISINGEYSIRFKHPLLEDDKLLPDGSTIELTRRDAGPPLYVIGIKDGCPVELISMEYPDKGRISIPYNTRTLLMFFRTVIGNYCGEENFNSTFFTMKCGTVIHARDVLAGRGGDADVSEVFSFLKDVQEIVAFNNYGSIQYHIHRDQDGEFYDLENPQ